MSSGAIIAIVFGLLGLVLIIILICSIRVVKQTDKYIIERLGGFYKAWGVGIHFLLPFFDRVACVVSMKEQVKDFEPQDVITKDNVTMKIDTIVFYTVTDPKLYAYGVADPVLAIENLSATTLRNIIGDLDLDQTLTSRDIINVRMREILDEATDPRGIKVNRVELKNILPPADIRESMERQMRAERERREKILLAEGEKKSKILLAEGEKQSMILNAEAEKEAAIKKAEGEAESILKIQRAEAEGYLYKKQSEVKALELIKNLGLDDKTLTLEAYRSMEKVANGTATKLIVPSSLQGLVGQAEILSDAFKNNK